MHTAAMSTRQRSWKLPRKSTRAACRRWASNMSMVRPFTFPSPPSQLGYIPSAWQMYINANLRWHKHPVDDCWSVESGRDNVTQRIIPDPTKFPSGINGTAAQVHSYGLKMGIYSSKYRLYYLHNGNEADSFAISGAGTETCAGYPASIGYEVTSHQPHLQSWPLI